MESENGARLATWPFLLVMATGAAAGSLLILRDQSVAMSLPGICTLASLVTVASITAVGLTGALKTWSSGFFYVTVLAVFHLGVPIARTIGAETPSNKIGYTNAWFTDTAELRTAIWLAMAATLAFSFGYVAMGSRTRRPTSPHTTEPPPGLGLVGFLLTILGAGMYIGYAALTAPALFRGAGKAYYEATIGGSSAVALGTMLSGIGVVMSAAAPPSKLRRNALLVFGVFAAFTLLIGSRTAALYAAVGLVVVLARVRPMPRKRVAVALIIGALLAISITGQIRDVGVAGATARDLLVAPTNGIHEMGGTLRPVQETVVLIEQGVQEFRSGQTYFVGAIRAGERALGLPRPEPDLRWADAIVSMRDDGYQIGYSAVAETYLNFGGIGTFVAFLALGIAFARWDNKNLGDPLSAARVGVIVVALVAAVRQPSNVMLTSILLGLFAIEVARRLPPTRATAPNPRTRRSFALR